MLARPRSSLMAMVAVAGLAVRPLSTRLGAPRARAS